MTDTLVFHHGALGDFVLTFPVWRGWDAVTVVAADSHVKLAGHLFPHVRGLNIDHADCTRLFAVDGFDAVGDPLRTLFGRARRIVSFVSDGSDAWASNVRVLAPEARMVFVQPRPPEGRRVHVCDWHAEQLREQGMEPGATDWAGWDGRLGCRWPAGAKRDAAFALGETPGATPMPPNLPDALALGENRVVVHPGSGGRAKCWPVERYLELIERLVQAGRRVRVLLGEVERERWSPELVAALASQAEVRQPASLVELAQELAAAEAYVGNDSGPTHLAAALGVPTVAIFGPTDPVVWQPRGPNVRVAASPGGWPEVRCVEASVVLG